MRIWIDVCNSPQVQFFAGLVRDLSAEHEVVLTSRPLANTLELLDQAHLPYHVVGRHYGANSMMKVAGLFTRVWQLYRFLRARKIDVAISHSSFYSPVVARLLGVRSIYLNDNEHAQGNRIAFQFADTIMVPEPLSLRLLRRHNARGNKIVRYPGVKEGIYLYSYADQVGLGARARGQDASDQPRSAPSTNSGQASEWGRSPRTRRIFVRPEPWTAQYYRGRKDFMDDLLIALAARKDLTVTVLPRGAEQGKHYKRKEFSGIDLPERTLELADIARECDLFLGAGGTMTREVAVLGVPTISVYQDKLLEVDKYLIRIGRMIHNRQPTPQFVLDCLDSLGRKAPANQLLSQGRSAYELIKKTLLQPRHKGGTISTC